MCVFFFFGILRWILCTSLCFGFSDFGLDFTLLAAFRISDCAKSCARRFQQAEIRSTRNQELEHEKPRIFFPAQITEIEGLVLRPLVLCSRPLVLVLPAIGSGAPGPWFWCSRPLVLVLQPLIFLLQTFAWASVSVRNWFLGPGPFWYLASECRVFLMTFQYVLLSPFWHHRHD